MPCLGEITRAKALARRYIWYACIDCGKERWVRLDSGKARSTKCKSCAEKGKHWKVSKVIKSGSGYILVWLQPNDFFYSMSQKHRYVLEHRLVMGKTFGS